MATRTKGQEERPRTKEERKKQTKEERKAKKKHVNILTCHQKKLHELSQFS